VVEEIVYTSAEKGLKQGSRGFCTVVSTAGMSLALAERLESMSGYRHAFPLHDPQASMNPVCFSHVTTRLAGKSLHVISRVADAGQDYTGRSNKLAHHLVIDNVASMPGGPARLMAEPGVIVEQWDGNVRNVPPRELRCAPLPASIPLVAWQSLTGDEGWAGSVAEQLLQNPAPVSIIFKAGTDTLTLVREVLDLVPAPQRWNVTFSTYFTRLLAGAECQLRFVLNDTPEATSLRNDARARVIDLTSSLPAATGGTLVAMARKGQLTPQEPAPTPAAPAVRARTAVEISTKDTGVEISIPKLKPGLSALETPDKPQPPRDLPPPVRVNIRKGVWIGLAVALLLVVVTGTLIFMRSGKKTDPFADLVSQTVPKDGPATKDENEATRVRQKERRDLEELERQAKLAAEQAAVDNANDQRMEADKLAAEETAKQQAKLDERAAIAKREKDAIDAALTKEGPFAFIRGNPSFEDKEGQWLFNLPRPGERYDDVWPKLRTNGETISLSLCEGARPLFSGSSYQLSLKQHETQLNEWTVEATQAGTVEQIARYTIAELTRDPAMIKEPDRELHFEWLRSASREIIASELLRWWPIEIQIGSRKAVLLQRKAEIPESLDGRPTWKSLVNSERIPIMNSNAIKAIEFDKAANTKFVIEIAQAGLSVQKLEVSILSETAGPESERQQEIPNTERGEHADILKQQGTVTKYFHVTPPLELMETIPEITETLTGFGKLELSVAQAPKTGLTINPKIKLLLRLPKINLLDTLPDISTNAGLKAMIKVPSKFVSWDSILAEGAIVNIQNTRSEIRNDPDKWYTQKMKPIPARQSFVSDTFSNLSRQAIEAIRGVIPALTRDVGVAQAAVNRLNAKALKELGDEQKLNNAKQHLTQAQSQLEAAKKYEPLIQTFTAAMGKMSQEMKETNSLLLRDYDTIAVQVNSCVEAIEQVHVRCTLQGEVLIEGCDNGPKVFVYFLETASPNWPADTTQQGAK